MITPQQREARKHYIGSSDAPAICGVDPYRNAHAVYLEKTGKLDGDGGNEHTERGNLLEPVLLTWAEQRLNAALLRDLMKVHENGILAANYDGIQPKVHDRPAGDLNVMARVVANGADPDTAQSVLDEPFIVEAKTSTDPDQWGEDGTDQVPDRVMVQVHHALYVAGPEFRIAWVPVLLPVFHRFDFRMFRIERNDRLAEVIAQQGLEFWEKYVKRDEPPTDCVPSIEVLRRMRRVPEKTVELDDEVVDCWIAARAARLQAEKDEKDAQAALLLALGDAEAGSFAKGEISYFETTRKEHVVKASTFRQLRLKAAKQTAALAAKETV